MTENNHKVVNFRFSPKFTEVPRWIYIHLYMYMQYLLGSGKTQMMGGGGFGEGH